MHFASDGLLTDGCYEVLHRIKSIHTTLDSAKQQLRMYKKYLDAENEYSYMGSRIIEEGVSFIDKLPIIIVHNEINSRMAERYQIEKHYLYEE